MMLAERASKTIEVAFPRVKSERGRLYHPTGPDEPIGQYSRKTTMHHRGVGRDRESGRLGADDLRAPQLAPAPAWNDWADRTRHVASQAARCRRRNAAKERTYSPSVGPAVYLQSRAFRFAADSARSADSSDSLSLQAIYKFNIAIKLNLYFANFRLGRAVIQSSWLHVLAD
jgi:hypothetical protein